MTQHGGDWQPHCRTVLCHARARLAVLLGAMGLGWLVGSVDDVVSPVLVICLGLVGYALWRRATRA
ncbi:MAG TPA: mercury resistance system transport protein MerF [Candidatus Tectomicrobia bacterium]